MVAKINTLDTNYIISEYKRGIGVVGIAKALNVSPSPIKRIILQSGIPLRNRSQQQQARMDITSDEDRKKLVKAANKAAKGRLVTSQEIEKRNRTLVARKSVKTSEIEIAFTELLDDAKIPYSKQVVCGRYICDFVINGVAVEIWGGNFHFMGAHIARSEERFKYLLGRFKGAIIVTINKTNPLGIGLRNAVIASAQELGSHPSFSGEYRMIWRNGKFITGNRINNDNFAFEYPFRNRRNTKSGRYECVA